MNKRLLTILLILLLISNAISINAVIDVNRKLKSEKQINEALSREITFFTVNQEEKLFQRNILDQTARELFNAFESRDLEFIKLHLSSTAKINAEKIVFKDSNGEYEFDYVDPDSNYELRQRYFEFIEEGKYVSAYEISTDQLDYYIVVNFIFVKEDLNWKLSGLYFE